MERARRENGCQIEDRLDAVGVDDLGDPHMERRGDRIWSAPAGKMDAKSKQRFRFGEEKRGSGYGAVGLRQRLCPAADMERARLDEDALPPPVGRRKRNAAAVPHRNENARQWQHQRPRPRISTKDKTAYYIL